MTSFDGWGTSLCWWANQYGLETGDYGASYLADLIFGSGTVKDPKGAALPGLGINIVRYNIGGGGGGATIHADGKDTVELISPCNPVSGPTVFPCDPVGDHLYRYIRGFWKKWGPDDENTDNPEYWDWTVDANQRAMLALARDRGANMIEFFSNSPPWWMCNNHWSSGGDVTSALTGNLQSWNVDKFAKYLVTVVKYARQHWGTDVSSIEPFNEPDLPSWYYARPKSKEHPLTQVYSKQEGCNFGCDRAAKVADAVLQQDVIDALYSELRASGLRGVVALTASDWNSIDYAVMNWGFLATDPVWRNLTAIEKVNVHGYDGLDPYRGTKRAEFRDKVRETLPRAKLWMSEYGDDDPTGIKMATSIMLDLAELQPSAWVLWQVVDPSWGLFENSTSDREVIGAPYASYYVFAQFSRHVTKGCKIIGDITIIGNDDNLTPGDLKNVIAYDDSKRKLVIVTLNLERGRWITCDISGVRHAAGLVKRWETTGDGRKKYEVGQLGTNATGFRFYCEPNSVSTFEIQDVTL